MAEARWSLRPPGEQAVEFDRDTPTAPVRNRGAQQLRCSFCQAELGEDIELTTRGSGKQRQRTSTSSFARRTAETAFWHWPSSTRPHWRRATSSQSVRCSPIGSSTYGATAKDQTRRSSYRLPGPPVADSRVPTRSDRRASESQSSSEQGRGGPASQRGRHASGGNRCMHSRAQAARGEPIARSQALRVFRDRLRGSSSTWADWSLMKPQFAQVSGNASPRRSIGPAPDHMVERDPLVPAVPVLVAAERAGHARSSTPQEVEDGRLRRHSLRHRSASGVRHRSSRSAHALGLMLNEGRLPAAATRSPTASPPHFGVLIGPDKF